MHGFEVSSAYKQISGNNNIKSSYHFLSTYYVLGPKIKGFTDIMVSQISKEHQISGKFTISPPPCPTQYLLG